MEEQQRSVFAYRYSVFQTEYSRKLLFRSGRQMHEVVQVLIDRTRGRLYLDRVKAISGDQKRPHCERRKQKPNRGGVVIETLEYDLTVFKVVTANAVKVAAAEKGGSADDSGSTGG